MRTRSRGYILASAVVVICILYWTFKASASAYARFRYVTDIKGPYREQLEDLASPILDTQPKSNTDDEHDLQLPQVDTEPETEAATTQSAYPARLPRIIWQAVDDGEQKKYAKEINTWQTIREFEHQFLTDKDANEFVSNHFKQRPEISEFWQKLKPKATRRSLLRYLVMLAEGGVFCDISSSVRIPPDLWIPADLGAKFIHAIIGIEYDNTDDPSFTHPIAFGIRTLFSKPGHPIFEKTVSQVMSNLDAVAQEQGKDLAALDLSDKELTAAVGSNVFTDAVLEALQDQGQNVSFATFQDMKKAKLVGDVLILPINAFAGGELHNTHAGDLDYGTIFVRYPNLRFKAGGPKSKSSS